MPPNNRFQPTVCGAQDRAIFIQRHTTLLGPAPRRLKRNRSALCVRALAVVLKDYISYTLAKPAMPLCVGLATAAQRKTRPDVQPDALSRTIT